MPQHRQHANPPTLMLRLERLLSGGAEDGGGDEGWLQLAASLWPRLTKWYGWLVRTQAGELAHTFRWRGRDANDRRLNALTLSSGLDDYPRATVRHRTSPPLEPPTGQSPRRVQLPSRRPSAPPRRVRVLWQVPSKKERHVDMLCWVAFCSRLLGKLAGRLGKPDEQAEFEGAPRPST